MLSRTATVGEMLDGGVTVRVHCQQCERGRKADLARIVAAKGRDYRLTDRRAPCPTEGCGYWVTFYAQGGLRNLSLTTEAGFLRNMDRRTAWLRDRRAKTPAL